MLTTSPGRAARHNSNRMVRDSSRAFSPSREIWPEVGSTHQEPMRSIVMIGGSYRTFQNDSDDFRPSSGLPGR
jgi:hypothetical protein